MAIGSILGSLTQTTRERLARALCNPLPFPLTIRHYYSFGQFTTGLKDAQLSSLESWDLLRTRHPHFVIPENREAWLGGLQEKKDGQDDGTKVRAAQIAELLRLRGITDVHSVGAGGGALEYYLKAAVPSVRLTASDYASQGVSRLQKVFTECDQVIVFDILGGDWNAIQSRPAHSLVLIYRVDPLFTNKEWRAIFEKMAGCGVQNVLFTPDYLLSLRDVVNMQVRYWKARVTGSPISFVGYDRSPQTLRSFWRGLYDDQEVPLAWHPSYWLKKL